MVPPGEFWVLFLVFIRMDQDDACTPFGLELVHSKYSIHLVITITKSVVLKLLPRNLFYRLGIMSSGG